MSDGRDASPGARASSVRSWRFCSGREVLFAVLGLPVALACFGYVALTLYAGTLLALTIAGLPVLAACLRGARRLGDVHRALICWVYPETVAAPSAIPRATGLVPWVRASLTDSVSWRALGYLALRLPLAVLGVLAAAGLPAAGIWLGGFPFWARIMAGPGDQVTSWWTALILVPIGLALLVATPAAIRGTGVLNRCLAKLLLGPTPGQQQLGALRQARGTLVAESTRSLRGIERDLHDGTQAELVAIAITLALAEDELMSHPEMGSGRLPTLLERARHETDGAIVGLRRITDGINPVALDGGLGSALASLVARCAVPVTLDLEGLPPDPAEHPDHAEHLDPAIERVVYFCVAELLTNVAKHSDATQASVSVSVVGGQVRVQVSDDGRGGALEGPGSGLSGLAERLSAVDGTLTVVSPPEAGTTVTAQLPSRI